MSNRTELSDKLAIVDVGCRWGFEAHIHDAEILFDYWGFDPDQEECARLASTAPENYAFIPACLGSEYQDSVVFNTKEPACSSLYKPVEFYSQNYKFMNDTECTSVSQTKVIRLDDWCRENSVDHIDYIKIDTQGSELEVLRGCGALLNSVAALDVEVQFNPMYENVPSFWQIDYTLRQAGLVLYHFETLCHYDTPASRQTSNNMRVAFDSIEKSIPMGSGQLFWGDAFYVRNSLLPINRQSASRRELDRAEKLFKLLNKPIDVTHLGCQ